MAIKVADKLTEAALAERLEEVLNRASQGEEFVIERDGEVIAFDRSTKRGLESNAARACDYIGAITPA